LLAGLELARHGEFALAQEDAFMPIHMRRVVTVTPISAPVDAGELIST